MKCGISSEGWKSEDDIRQNEIPTHTSTHSHSHTAVSSLSRFPQLRITDDDDDGDIR